MVPLEYVHEHLNFRSDKAMYTYVHQTPQMIVPLESVDTYHKIKNDFFKSQFIYSNRDVYIASR
jgi:hypothetical protein